METHYGYERCWGRGQGGTRDSRHQALDVAENIGAVCSEI